MISKTFDWIERMVTPSKPAILPDPQSISNNAYNQWGTPDHTHSFVPVGINSAQANAIYQNATYTVTGTGIGSAVPNSQYITGNPQAGSGIFFPSPTGMLCQISFTDANGQAWLLTVDQAFAQAMAQISQYHQYRGMAVVGIQAAPWPISAPAPQKMVEGDFSFDEMEEAEHIILELEGAHNESLQTEGTAQA